VNRIDARFADLKRRRRKALIAYVTGGFPSMSGMTRAVADLERAGVDLLEIGVPFSDPIADGPTIQYSSHQALLGGVTPTKILAWTAMFRKRSALPVVLMSYLNPLHRMGYDEFATRARASGVDGVIVPDLIPEEAGALVKCLNAQGLRLIYLVAPTTPLKRRAWLGKKSRGFLYAVSITGVTGARKSLPSDVTAFLRSLKTVARAPVAVGFGIAGPEQVRRFAPYADGVIFGSALIQRLREKKPVYPFVSSLRKALDQGK